MAKNRPPVIRRSSVSEHDPSYAVREIGIFDHMDRGTVSPSTFFEQRLALTELYDRLGFYSYHVAEHHATPLGSSPSPNLFLSMVAARTRRLRVGALVYLVPLYHPLRLLEEICMLDQMSSGRLDVGVGRGISPIESRFYGANPDVSQKVFEEAFAILCDGFGTGSLTFNGDFFAFNDVPIEVTPYQRPHPPFWYGASSPESAERSARRGFNLLTLSPSGIAAATITAYHATAQALGANDLLGGIGRFVVVAESDERARAIAEPAYARWFESFNTLYRKFGRGPVQGERPRTFAAVIDAGIGIAGTPATVLATLQAQARQTNSNYVVCQFAFGDMDHADAVRSIELFASDVMPQLLGRVPAGVSG
jgi:alkanesulfonate monooxygenase SsuD/methylene tetrahydromethanopterin reductase-like flavin-dependent oxidoreductase (luciferase family)